jgi:hypothetical protein
MNDKLYIVWVGGVEDYEGYNLKDAESVVEEWQEQGYDDVILETIEVIA